MKSSRPPNAGLNRAAVPVVAIIPFLILAAACSTLRSTPLVQPQAITMDGPYTNRQTGIVFPEKVSSFVRNQIVRFDAETNNVSVGYHFPSPAFPVIVTIYIYEAPTVVSVGSPPDVVQATRMTLLRVHFQQILDAILGSHPDAKLITDEPETWRKSGVEYPGFKGVFRMLYDFPLDTEEATSTLYLFQKGDWLLKYRISYPENAKARLEPTVKEFIDKLVWPKDV